MFDKKIENYKNNIINSLCDLIKFESVSIETNNPDMPFGENCKNVLDYTLNLAKNWGFRTKNLNGYCGYIEFGDGEEIVGIIGHLDVVPASLEDGWTNPPFEPNIHDNKIFGRGAIDDKGPVISALYGMKAVLESEKKINKRVRLILGLNEETNWKCVKYYKKIGEEMPTIGFSPDASFPCIYAEKGRLAVKLFHPFNIENMTILNIDCNNNALNVVPKYCSITLKYNSQKNRIVFENTEKISTENIDENTIKIIAHGIASHSAHPELGDNAITTLLTYLNSHIDNPLLSGLSNLGILNTTSPKFLSPDEIKDESGIMTSNVGFLGYENNNLQIGFDLRVPVTISLNEIKEKYKKLVETFPKINVNFTSEQAPIYIEKDSFLVKTLTNIFNQKTELNLNPITMGGATYARAFPNCVAFGAIMPGQKDMCHQVDEFIDIDTLILSSKIYAQAIYELAK